MIAHYALLFSPPQTLILLSLSLSPLDGCTCHSLAQESRCLPSHFTRQTPIYPLRLCSNTPWVPGTPHPSLCSSPTCGGSRASLSGIVSPFPPASRSARPGLPSPPPLQVAPQPLWFSDTVANLRKLKELPYHLLHSGRLEELKEEVLGKPWAGPSTVLPLSRAWEE